MRQIEFSPMGAMDFDIMNEVYNSVSWMGPEDIKLALAELESQGGTNQNNIMIGMMLMNLWAKKDGKGALEYSLASKNHMTKG